MTKIYTGSTINYGPQLPASDSVGDGSLFFKTSDDGQSRGLYVFRLIQDTNNVLFGDQVGQGWVPASSGSEDDYVLKTGSIMTGVLEGVGFKSSRGLPTGDLATYGYSFSTDGDTGMFSVGPAGGATELSLYLNSAERIKITATDVLIAGNRAWHAGNDGSGSGSDADLLDGQEGSYYLNSLNQTGTVPLNRGGTGTTAFAAGSLVYGGGSTLLGSTVGTAGQVLLSGGSGEPTWINQNQLAGGDAATATNATNAGITSDSTNATRFVTFVDATSGNQPMKANNNLTYNPSTNVLNATVALASKASTLAQNGGNGLAMTFNWAGQVGTPTFLWGSEDGVNHYVYSPGNMTIGAADTVPWTGVSGRPTLFYDFATGASPSPTTFPASSIAGFDAVNNSDFPSPLWVGLQVMGSAGGGTRGLQIAGHWNAEELAPSDLAFRVNDDTGDTASWGAWSTIWNSANFTPANYLQLSGGSLSGILNSNANIETSSTIIGSSVSTTQAANLGRVDLQSGTASQTGFVEFHAPDGSRRAYIGFGSGTNLLYNLENGFTTHSFTGDIATSGGITAGGNITAYYSDGRLKKNVKPIVNALAKVKQLGGYSYDWDLEKCESIGFTPDNEHEHGLIAQDVEEVFPEAVVPAANPEYKTVRYEKLVALLMAAVNEQQKQIITLQSELEILKAK